MRSKSGIGAAVLLLAVAGVLAARPACASLISTFSTPSALGIAIPDDTYNGTLASMASASITVPALSQPIVTDVTITTAITHSFVGDLVFKLLGPDGATLVTLVNRPGLPGGPDNGSEVGGDSSQLSASFPITFDDNAPSGVLSEEMGQGIPGSAIIGDPANGSPNNYIPYADGAGIGQLAAFDGLNAAGVWTLYVGDAGPGATGVIQSFSLNITSASPPVIPEPASASLLLGGALLLVCRRRSRCR